MEAVRRQVGALENASKELMGVRDAAMEAVKRQGCARKYASKELKG